MDLQQAPGQLNAEIAAHAERLLHAAGLGALSKLEELAGGANNKIFLATAGAKKAVLKAYFQHPQDRRDRLKAEFAFCSFAWSQGVRGVPKPLAEDAKHGLGLYEYVAGRRCQAPDVNAAAVAQAAELVHGLNERKDAPEAKSLPPASDACLSWGDHRRLAEGRLEKLRAWKPGSTALDREAAAFIQELAQAWTKLKPPRKSDKPLPESERCVSPSDFGFHNALLEPNGRVRFLDFEYAGWDDPAKLVCDFFCQPAVPVPREFFDGFLEAVAPARREAVAAAMPLHRVKWIGLMLSDFLPQVAERRLWAMDPEALEKRKAAQLAKARQALAEFLKEPTWPT